MSEPTLSQRALNLMPLLVVLSLAAWVLCLSSSLIRADAASMQARFRLDSWLSGRGQWTIAEWLEARDALQEAVEITPANPMLHDYLGSLFALRGIQAWRSEALRKDYFAEAMAHQRVSLSLREHNAPAWAALSLSLYATGAQGEALWDAERRAIALGQSEPGVRRVLLDVIFPNWATQPQDLRDWATRCYRTAVEGERKAILSQARQHGLKIFPD